MRRAADSRRSARAHGTTAVAVAALLSAGLVGCAHKRAPPRTGDEGELARLERALERSSAGIAALDPAHQGRRKGGGQGPNAGAASAPPQDGGPRGADEADDGEAARERTDATPTAPPAPDEPSTDAPNMSMSSGSSGTVHPRTRCERICDLADDTCEIGDRICDLARSHGGEVRYQDSCRSAEDQCGYAQESCHACS